MISQTCLWSLIFLGFLCIFSWMHWAVHQHWPLMAQLPSMFGFGKAIAPHFNVGTVLNADLSLVNHILDEEVPNLDMFFVFRAWRSFFFLHCHCALVVLVYYVFLYCILVPWGRQYCMCSMLGNDFVYSWAQTWSSFGYLFFASMIDWWLHLSLLLLLLLCGPCSPHVLHMMHQHTSGWFPNYQMKKHHIFCPL